jgi:glucose dehydrogenase
MLSKVKAQIRAPRLLLVVVLCACTAILLIPGCKRSSSHTSSAQQPEEEKNYIAQPYLGRMDADDGQWIRPAKDYASTRYSSLDQINTGNVSQLKLASRARSGAARREQHDVHRDAVP